MLLSARAVANAAGCWLETATIVAWSDMLGCYL
jgi:hypothetical protein